MPNYLRKSTNFKIEAKKILNLVYLFSTIFSAYYFLKVYLLHFSKIEIQKESQNEIFNLLFCEDTF